MTVCTFYRFLNFQIQISQNRATATPLIAHLLPEKHRLNQTLQNTREQSSLRCRIDARPTASNLSTPTRAWLQPRLLPLIVRCLHASPQRMTSQWKPTAAAISRQSWHAAVFTRVAQTFFFIDLNVTYDLEF